MLELAKPVTDQISNTASKVSHAAIPVITNVASKVSEVGKSDAPNYKVAAAAGMLLLANTLLNSYNGNYYTSWFNALCTIGTAAAFTNQYCSSNACPSVVKNTMSFFKEKMNAVLGNEQPTAEAVANIQLRRRSS